MEKEIAFSIKMDLSMMSQHIRSHVVHRSSDIIKLVDSTVKDYCTDGSIEKLIDTEVRRMLTDSVKDSIEKYFRFGNGRNYITKQVESALDTVIIK